MVGFRPRADQLEYLERVVSGGYKITEILSKTFDLSIELEKELGDSLRKLEAVAALEGITVGAVLARLVKQNMADIDARLSSKK